jgi:two-component system sensor histidine kinase HydH
MQRIQSHRARWGLLVTTLFMALALVATGISSFVGARRTARELTTARTRDLGMLVRHSLRFGEQSDLVDLVAEATDQGLRGVAIVSPNGAAWKLAGIEAIDATHAASRCDRTTVTEGDDTLFVAQPMRPGCGVGRGLGRGCKRGHPTGRPPAGACMVLALDPDAASSVVSSAGITLLLAVMAATLLLAVALTLWRASRRAELLDAELVRDRHLRVLGEMSAVLGHELRNPLASLKGHAQLLLEKTALDHPAYTGAERVVREAQRLERLTIEVLEYARTAELDFAAAEPLAIARASAAAVAPELIDVVEETPPPRWLLDAHRMQQVLENLLRNAVQASPDGARITLRVAGETERLLFEVRDRGPGIEPGATERIFEPFVTGQVHGTGLGLALAKRIVEGHGGTITACPHAEGGALLRISLPLGPAGGLS